MTINKLGLGLALACGTLAVGANFAAPAQAAKLTGTVNITGVSDFKSTSFVPPANDVVTFSHAKVQASSTGIFSSYIGQGVTLSDIKLTSPTNVSITPQKTQATYVASAPNPFITFSDDLKFIVDNPFEFQRTATRLSGVNILTGSAVFSGLFQNASGKNVGIGIVSIQEIKENGSFALTLDATSVPEPATVFGLTTVLAAGYLSRKKLVKKQLTQKTHP
ncbi:PEP-CTERM sorting domain-containing protein [Anabaena azotica]|uniref:PEP-CTERM sorting domain-containing protein n=1 Tax=Anabaena azotica FACHB-119 TaxID=947527 RepID=A0ABR8D6C4_9NOST|nr:PEP-CTERM sorting domain-containing protein [Anabaena azotica]MBD2501696.1 PEP-CTERM sorting domain-containing protein [Anabaena azotica FACHB-119]